MVDLSTTELIGYAASLLIVASLAMTSVVRLRIISLIGSLTYVVYGVLLPSIPIILTNAIIAGLNIWFLSKEFSPRRDLGAVPIATDAPFLIDFVESHRGDIATSQPEFIEIDDADSAWLLTRDGLPAGVLIGKRVGTTLETRLDYVMAPYRDSRIGQWLYGDGARVLRDAGIRRVTAHTTTKVHADYLARVGFAANPGAGSDRWLEKALD